MHTNTSENITYIVLAIINKYNKTIVNFMDTKII